MRRRTRPLALWMAKSLVAGPVASMKLRNAPENGWESGAGIGVEIEVETGVETGVGTEAAIGVAVAALAGIAPLEIDTTSRAPSKAR